MNGDQIRTIVEAVQQALEDRRELAGLSRRSELQPRCFRCGVVHGSQRCPFGNYFTNSTNHQNRVIPRFNNCNYGNYRNHVNSSINQGRLNYNNNHNRICFRQNPNFDSNQIRQGFGQNPNLRNNGWNSRYNTNFNERNSANRNMRSDWRENRPIIQRPDPQTQNLNRRNPQTSTNNNILVENTIIEDKEPENDEIFDVEDGGLIQRMVRNGCVNLVKIPKSSEMPTSREESASDDDNSSTDYQALEQANLARFWQEQYTTWERENRFFRYENGRIYALNADSGVDSDGIGINSLDEEASDGLQEEFHAWLAPPAQINNLNAELENPNHPIHPNAPLNNLQSSESDDQNILAVRVRRQRRRPRRGYRRSRNAGRFAISHHRRRPPSSTDGSSTRPNSPRCTCIDCPIHGLLARYSSPAAPASPPPAVIIPSTPASPEPNDGQDAPILERWERYELVSESSDNGNDAEVEAESDEGLQNPSGASMSREMAEDK